MKRIYHLAAIASLIFTSPLLFANQPETPVGTTHPATQEWVLAQLAKMPTGGQKLTESSWAAVCQSGSMTSPGGCFGNVSTPAFQALDVGIGGFTDYANIGIANVANSVFIKKYLGTDGNAPGNGSSVDVSVNGAIARCEIFSEPGQEISYEGIANFASSTNSDLEAPEGELYQIPNGQSANITVADNNNSSEPLMRTGRGVYLICVGVNSAANPTAASIAGTTATWS